MNVDIEQVVTYPMESDDWILTVLIGGALSIFSFLLIPWFIVMGYILEDLRAGMEGAAEPPVFEDWGTLLKEGFVGAVIAFIYQLVPLIVFFFMVGGSILAMLTGSDAGTGIGIAGLLAGIFVTWVLAIIFGYIGFAGIANYAREGNFAAGFDVGVISDVVTSRAYLVAWGYAILISIGFGLLSGVLGIVPIIGALIGVFVTFYGMIAIAWILGNGFAEATETTTTTTPDAAGAAQ